jgi:glutaryl-CoA dehydrogenase
MNGLAGTSGANGPITRLNGARPAVEPPVLGTPEHSDYYRIDELLTDDQRALRARVRTFMDDEVEPIINGYWERAVFPHELIPRLAQLNLAGFQIPGYGCPGTVFLPLRCCQS